MLKNCESQSDTAVLHGFVYLKWINRVSPVSTLLLYTMIMGLGNDFLSLPFTSLNKPSIEHGFKLTSVYSHYLKESGHREITTYHSRTAITVDYIFYSPAQREESGWAGEICVCV